MAKNNVDVELLAGLSIDSSEAEILKAIKIIEKRLKANHDARFKLNIDIDETVIRNTVDKLQNILKGKELKIDTKSSIEAITKEVNAMGDIVTVAKKAANEKIEFAKANERVRNSADDTADAVNRERDAMDSLDDVETILNGINNCGANGNSVFQRFGNTLRDAFSAYTTVNLLERGLNKVVDAGKEAVEVVKEFDDINVDLQLASGEDKGYVKQLLDDYSELGSELGALTQTVAESSDTFLRQGRSISETNQLIEDSIILSKVAKTDGETASEILTATINGFQLAASEGSRINDVLSSIDLNSASSAQGIGTALTKVASMANNAGVSLEKTAAMIATIKDITQDADTTIGTSMKTVLSRMNNIRANKLFDEETGEPLNDVEKVLASINVSMRDVNGQFKEAEIIIDEVGSKWKTLDGNTQKAVTTAMGGVYQANKLVALFDNYEKVIELTNIAQNSTGQALEKFNDSYLPSLEAKTQALQNSLQQLATTTISDDLYASVLDVSKEVVDLTTETGILKSALAGIGVGGSLYAFSQLATFMREATQGFSNFSNALNMVNRGAVTTVDDMQTLVNLSHGLSNSQMRLLLSTTNLTDAQKISLMVSNGVEQELAEQQLQIWGLINAQNTMTGVTATLTSTVRGFIATLAANPIVLVTMAVTAGVTAFNKYKQAQEEVIQTAREASAVYKDNTNSIDDYVAKYEELHKALQKAKGNEEETYNVKQQLLELQTELNEKFGDEVGKLNLVTDAYKDQTEAIKGLSEASANEFLNSNRKGIEKADKEMNREKAYQLGSMNGLVNADELDILEQIKAIAESKGIDFTDTGFEFIGNANEATDVINSFMNDIKELQVESGKTSDVMSGIFDGILDSSSGALGKADSIIDKYGEIYEQAQMATIATNENLSSGYNNAISAVEAYNEAVLKSEDPYKDENVKSAWDNLQTVKNGIQENEEEWGRYSNIMDNVFASANDKVYSFYDALMNSSELSSFAEELRGLTDVEVKSMVNDGNTDAFDKLAEKAKTYGLEVQDVIDLLIELGYVQGKVIKEVEDVEVSVVPSFDYKKLEDLESSVSSIQSAYDTVIGAIKEYNKQGFLNMDTIDSLIALDDAYINTLIDENGQLQYNSETFRKLAQIKLEEAKASIYQEACLELTRIKELDSALAAQELALVNGTLTESAYEVAKALHEEIIAMGGANAVLAQSTWENAQKKVALLDNQLKNVTTSTYDFAKSSGSAKKEFNETMDFFDERIDKINDALSLLKANIENVVGSFAKNILIDAQININNEALDNYNDALAMYSQKASEVLSDIPNELRSKVINGDVSIVDFVGDDNEQIVKNIKEYQEWSEKIQQCKQEIVELQETISQLSLDKFKNVAQDFTDQFDIRDSIKSNIESHIDLIEKSGEMVGESLFSTLLEQSKKQLQILEREKVALANELTSALSSGNIKKGSDEWLEMVGVLTELDGEIINCKSSIEEFSNEILEIDTKVFERIQKQFSNIDSELENIVDLMNNYDIVGDNGEFTNEGLVALGALSQKYELAQHQLEQYQSEIAELNEAYADGKVSAIEYSDRLAELVSEQWNCVDSIQNVKNEMVDLHEQRIDKVIEGIEKEKDALRELTDARIDELNVQKEADDYRESLGDATKNVTDIEKQISAMQFDTSASGIAKRKQLEEELVKAKKELGKLEKDHALETQIDSLEKQYENFEIEKDSETEKLQESLNDREKLISDSFETVKQNSNIIGQEIANIANKHGVTISNAIVSSWQSGENAIASYGAVLDVHSSAFIGELMGVENEVYNLQAQANNTANSLVGMFSTRADNLVNELVSSYNSIGNVNAMTNALKNSLVNTLEGGYNVSGITSALNNITDAANTAKGALDRLQQASGNKVNYAPTPTEIVVVGKTDTSLKTYMDETLESKKQPTSNTSFNNMLDNSLSNQFLKKKVSGFSKGGVVTKEDDNILKPIAESVGEDTMVAVKYGESIITKEQRENLHKFLEGWNKDRTVNNTGDSTLLRRQMDGIYDFSGVNPSQFVANYTQPLFTAPKLPEFVQRNTSAPTLEFNGTLMHIDKVDSTNIKQMESIAHNTVREFIIDLNKGLKYGSGNLKWNFKKKV